MLDEVINSMMWPSPVCFVSLVPSVRIQQWGSEFRNLRRSSTAGNVTRVKQIRDHQLTFDKSGIRMNKEDSSLKPQRPWTRQNKVSRSPSAEPYLSKASQRKQEIEVDASSQSFPTPKQQLGLTTAEELANYANRRFSVFVPASEFYKQAKQSFDKGELGRARDLFHSCIQRDPLHSEAWYGLARTEGMIKGGPRATHRILRRALRYNRSNPKLYQSLGRLAFRLGNIELAAGYFQRGLRIHGLKSSDKASLLAAWGATEGSANYKAARGRFQEAIRVDPLCMRAHTGWARLEARCGDFQRSKQICMSCLEKLNDAKVKPNARLLQALGQAELVLGEYDLARVHFDQAIDESHSESVPSIIAHLAYGRMEASLGNITRADQVFAVASQRFPRHSRPSMLRALLAYAKGELDTAKTHAVEALTRHPRDVFLWNLIGQIERSQGNISRARAIFRRASEYNKNDWYVRDCWSRMEWDEGNREMAQKLTSQAFALRYKILYDFSPWANLLEDNSESILMSRLYHKPMLDRLPTRKRIKNG